MGRGPSKDPEGLFWAKVNKTDGCWYWIASLSGGYGQFHTSRGSVGAHRWAWELANGPIPSGMCVCHKCDTPVCVRLDHLFLGTIRDNNSDRATKGRSARQLGEDNGAHKLSPLEIPEVRSLYATGLFTQRDLAARFGVCQTQIGRIVTKRHWRAI